MMRLFFWALLPASLTSCMALDSNLSNIREESYKITTNKGISCRSKIPFLLQKYLDESIKISQVTWSGNCKNSELDGQGTLIGLDQNSQRVFQIKGVAKENSQRSYVSQFEQYEFDFLGKQYIGNQANSPIVFFYPSSLTIGDAIINIDDRNKYQGSFIGDPNTKKINYSFGFPYKLINEANKTELAVSLLREDRAIYSGIFKAPPALANIQTGENIPLGTLTQNGKFIACYVDSKKYNSQIECDHQFKKLESDIQNQLVIIDQKKDQEMATERQRLQQKRIEEQERVQQAKEEAQARRQEQWQQLGQVLGAAATGYVGYQVAKQGGSSPVYLPSQKIDWSNSIAQKYYTKKEIQKMYLNKCGSKIDAWYDAWIADEKSRPYYNEKKLDSKDIFFQKERDYMLGFGNNTDSGGGLGMRDETHDGTGRYYNEPRYYPDKNSEAAKRVWEGIRSYEGFIKRHKFYLQEAEKQASTVPKTDRRTYIAAYQTAGLAKACSYKFILSFWGES